MPTVIAAEAGRTPPSDETLQAMWIFGLVSRSLEFTGMLAAVDYLDQDESAVRPFCEQFRSLAGVYWFPPVGVGTLPARLLQIL